MPRTARLLRLLVAALALVVPLTGAAGAATAAKPTGGIAGTVSAPVGPLPDNLEATLYRQIDSLDEPDTSDWEEVAYDALGGDDATYAFTGLSSGRYRVLVETYDNDSSWAPTFFGDSDNLGHATVITLATNQKITGKNLSLLVGGSLSGHLLDSTGDPVAETDVTAYRYSTVDDDFSYAASTVTTEDGSFSVRGLAAGRYRLLFRGSQGRLWYGGDTEAHSAVVVSVALGADTGPLVAAYGASLSVSGTISDVDGPLMHEPYVVETSIAVFRHDDDADRWVFQDAQLPVVDTSGHYVVHGLTPGRYAFHVRADNAYTWRWIAGQRPDADVPSSYLDLTGDQATYDATLLREADATKRPRISGTAKAGKTLTAKPGTWTWLEAQATPDHFAYAWTRAGSSKVLGTKATYKVPSSLKGKKVQVSVTFVKTGYSATTEPSRTTSIAR